MHTPETSARAQHLTTMCAQRPHRWALTLFAFLAFASLGLPDGLLGVAWPSVRAEFSVPLSRLGHLLAAAMVGYLASSFTSGALVRQLGVGWLLFWSTLLVVASLLGYAWSAAWVLLLLAGLLAGLGAGAIDAGINAYAAQAFSPRCITWLHASYGVGATIGPLVMTAALMSGTGWRRGYLIVGVLLTAMAVCFLMTVRWWDADSPASAPARQAGPSIAAALAQPRVWHQALLFFVYTGLEVAAGQWSFTWLHEGRGLGMDVAGFAVSAYWASLTAGRVAFGLLAGRVGAEPILRAAIAATVLGALAMCVADGAGPSVAALALLGFAFAPIYPLMIAATPARVGREFAGHAIGFQVASAYLGAAALPGLGGWLSLRAGLGAIPVLVLAGALVLLALHEGMRRHTATA
jgi:fucose permease